MQILRFTGDTSALKVVAESWRRECNGNAMGIDLDMDVHLADLQRLADSPDSDLFVLYDGEPVGYMGLTVFQSPIGNQRIANEHYWYIIPSKRGISALRFLKAAQEWAKEKGCSHLLMNASCLASDLHDGVCKLYEHKGMKRFETTYIMGL